MKRFLQSPAFNAVCIGVFSSFYAAVFLLTAGHAEFTSTLYQGGNGSFWPAWGRFLAAGHQRYFAWALFGVTLLVIVLLLRRRRPYDEYHASILTHCLVVAMVLTMVAIALFYLLVLSDPAGIVEKFTLFVAINWATVVLANLAYVLLCRWR